MADEVTTPAGIDAIMRGVEIQHLLSMLIAHGVPDKTAASYAVGLAEFVRGIKISDDPNLARYVDIRAQQYEDIASSLLGGRLLPRDPKS